MQPANVIKPSVEFIADADDVSGNGQVVTGIPHIDQESYADILKSDRSAAQKARDILMLTRYRLAHIFSSVRPWGEFFERSSFIPPEGLSESIDRLRRNVPHFYSNYILLSLICSSYILLINLWFSVVALLTILGYYWIRSASADSIANGDHSGSIYFFDRNWSTTELYTLLAICGIVGFYIWGGSSVMFWLAFTTVGVSGVHAIMRRPSLDAPQNYNFP